MCGFGKRDFMIAAVNLHQVLGGCATGSKIFRCESRSRRCEFTCRTEPEALKDFAAPIMRSAAAATRALMDFATGCDKTAPRNRNTV